MGINISNISKKFKGCRALDNVSLNIEDGELVALIGPSGSGKTTLLRIISGLEHPDLGCVYISGEDITVKSLKDRKIGFVFQHYALFRHMTVFDNVAFGLTVLPKEVRPSKDFIAEKVHNLLQLVHIEQLAGRYPSQLSGGQRQRVALARSLAVEPKILLLDEPFGALDSKVRKELRRWLRRLHDEFSVTTIFVTHDQEEAMEVADKIVVMNAGKIEQVGTPEEVYHRPANAFVYDFLGNYNLFTGARNEKGEVNITQYKSKSSVNRKLINKAIPWFSKIPLVGKFFVNSSLEENVVEHEQNSSDDNLIQIFARPHDMEIFRKPEAGKFIPVKLVHINPAGPLIKLEMETEDGVVIQAEITKDLLENLKLKKGETLFTRPKEIKIFE